MTTLSVIIATRGRPSWAAATVRGVLAEKAVEVIVVDQSDEPHALRDAVADLPVRFHTAPPRGLPFGRNLGTRLATSEVLLFLDDDVTVLPGLLDAHLTPYEDESVGGVVGRIAEVSVRPNARGPINEVSRGGRIRTNLWGVADGSVGSLKGANMSFRASVIRAIGGFDLNYRGTAFLEDTDVSERARQLGWALRFQPRAEVIHHSAPRGGVRVASDRETERWRFHNTGYFLRRHRPASAPRAVATFTAIAARRAREWRDPAAVTFLMSAFQAGWHLGRGQPCLEPALDG